MKFASNVLSALVVGSLVCGALACGGKKAESTTTTQTQASLYDRLGGKDAITIVIDKFVGNVAADTRINARFANANIDHLKAMLVDQVCAATGGPCTYTGKDMKAAHAGMGLSEDEWNATVEDLVKALDEAGVKQAEKDELLGALGGMKADIVGQ